MTTKLALVAAAAGSFSIAVCSSPALADDNAPYVKALGGVGWLADTSIAGSAGFLGETSLEAGWASGLAAGYDFGNWRLEGEMLYRTNESDDFVGSGLPAGAEAGDFSSLSLAANALYEIDLFGSPRATTFIGAGIVWIEEVDFDFNTPGGEVSYSADDWGVQLFAGANYTLSDRWTLSAEVRHLFGGSIDLEGEGTATGNIEADYDHTMVQLGVEYRF